MHIKRVAQREGQRGRGPEIWCGSEPIICTNLFGLIDATAARFVSSFWLPHKVAACGAPKNLLNISTSAAVSAEENPPKKRRRNPGNKGYRGNNGNLPVVFIKCSFRFQFSLFFVLSRKGESSSGALSFSMPSNPCLLLSYKVQ